MPKNNQLPNAQQQSEGTLERKICGSITYMIVNYN